MIQNYNHVFAVASPGFVARRANVEISCHGELTVDFRAGCSSCSTTYSFVTDTVLIERVVTSASANLADYTIFG